MATLLYPSQLPQMVHGASTRWYPTPEQLAILRTMYRKGITTLSGSQIRVIASYLSFFGRIEPKNVFYWFQNRKARDRKKLRQFLSLQHRMSSSVAAVHETTSMLQPPQHSVDEYLHPFQTYLFGSDNNAHHFLQHQGHTLSLVLPGETSDETTQEANLSYKLVSNTEVEKQPTMNASTVEDDWIKIINLGANVRPVHTLELFPTKSNNGDLRM